MAFSAFVGTFALNTSTGNQSVTGVGFQPKLVLFWHCRRNAVGTNGDSVIGIGAAVSSSSRWAQFFLSDDGVAFNSTVVSWATQSACIIISSPAPAAEEVADFVSMDSDGFTINISTAGSARLIGYLALGGSDLTNVAIGKSDIGTTTGNKAVTGLGFQPDAMLFSAMREIATGSLPFGPTNVNTGWCTGFATSASARGVSANYAQTGAAAAVAGRLQRTDRILSWLTHSGASPILNSDADLVSFDSDGWTINVITNGSGASAYYFYVALKGGQYKVGSFSQKTSTGSQGTTGVGFQPVAAIWQSFGNTATTSVQTNQRYSTGASTGASNESGIWAGMQSAADPTQADRIQSTTSIYKAATAGTPTTEAEADLTSFDSDGFTLNYSTADATAREILYLAIGNAVASGRIFKLAGEGGGLAGPARGLVAQRCLE